MADHFEVEFPTELTKKQWDKAKGTIAKKHKTGLGESLTILEKTHKGVKWTNYTADGNIVGLDRDLKEWPSEFSKAFKPIIAVAAKVKDLAEKAEGVYKKDKLVPSSTVKAVQSLIKAVSKYRRDLEDFEGLYANAIVKRRKELVDVMRKTLAPTTKKMIAKCVGLLKDIKAYAGNPTKENFFKFFSDDSNARGYCTAIKMMDQYLGEFPDIRDPVFGKGVSLVKDLLPGMADYGASWSEQAFESKVNARLGISGEDAYKEHARLLVKQANTIAQFAKDGDKLLKLL